MTEQQSLVHEYDREMFMKKSMDVLWRTRHALVEAYLVIDHLGPALLLARYLSCVEVPLWPRLMMGDCDALGLWTLLLLGADFRLLMLVFLVGLAVEKMGFLLLFFEEFLVKRSCATC
jgi:hypothetical protein